MSFAMSGRGNRSCRGSEMQGRTGQRKRTHPLPTSGRHHCSTPAAIWSAAPAPPRPGLRPCCFPPPAIPLAPLLAQLAAPDDTRAAQCPTTTRPSARAPVLVVKRVRPQQPVSRRENHKKVTSDQKRKPPTRSRPSSRCWAHSPADRHVALCCCCATAFAFPSPSAPALIAMSNRPRNVTSTACGTSDGAECASLSPCSPVL